MAFQVADLVAGDLVMVAVLKKSSSSIDDLNLSRQALNGTLALTSSSGFL